MNIICRLRQLDVVKQISHHVDVLSGRNSVIPNIFHRLHSNVPYIPRINISSGVERRLQRIDKVPHGYILIYRSPMSNYITYCYHASYLFIIIGIFGIYYVKKYRNVSYPIVSLSSKLGASHVSHENENDAVLMFGGLIVTNLFLFCLCRRQALRIWFNPAEKQYTLYLAGNLPLLKNTLVFEPGIAMRKRKNPLTAIGHASHYINGKTYYFTESNFKTPSEYHKLLSHLPD